MTIDRQSFLPEGVIDTDEPILFDGKNTVPSKRITELMIDLLEVTPSDECLLIGTGSGYQTACLAERCKHVVSLDVEAFPGVQDKVPANVTLVTSNFLMYETLEKFDCVMVCCGIGEIGVECLKSFLKIGGRLVAPVGNTREQSLNKYIRTEAGFDDRGTFAYAKFGYME